MTPVIPTAVFFSIETCQVRLRSAYGSSPQCITGRCFHSPQVQRSTEQANGSQQI